jgi:outer membrane protein OmpA-like peptidoglycan-associated protein
MRKLVKMFNVALIGIGLLTANVANAQEFSVRVEPGIAIPAGDPQDDRFDVGASLAVKPELTVGSWVGVGPSSSVTVFHSTLEGIDPPVIWTLGGFLRIKRPHDQENTSSGAEAVSPWIDSDLQYVRTGDLNRVGWAVGLGAAFPASDERSVWVGPFARYQAVHQDETLDPTRNTNESHTVILGLSLEFGSSQKLPTPVKPSEPVTQPVVPKPELPKPPVTTFEEAEVQLSQVIQFAWDSEQLDSTAANQLDEVVKKLSFSLEKKDLKSIKIDGHASSEGQVHHNDKLSQRRADSVLEYLVSHGVPREKLTAVGHGSKEPVADNKTEDGRVLNRRAEFTVNFTILKEVKK